MAETVITSKEERRKRRVATTNDFFKAPVAVVCPRNGAIHANQNND